MLCERAYEIDGDGCPYYHAPAPPKKKLDKRGPDRQWSKCWYYTQPGGCKKGDKCDRVHEEQEGDEPVN
jgi:hypothetical protein